MTTSPASDPRVRGWVTSALLALGALLLLARDLGRPGVMVFDEVYYANDARDYLRLGGVEDGFAVHPPVGKWAIAAGIRLVGDSPTGWRVATVVAAVLTVVVVHRLGLRLLADLRLAEPLAVVAPLLLVFDGVFVVQARTAMLDAVLALLVVLGIHLVVVDRDVAGRDRPGPRPRSRWRLAAGVVLGLAVATKWSGLLGIGTAGLLSLTWLATRARAGEGWTSRATQREAVSIIGALLVVPAAVYVATWAPWAANAAVSWNGPCPGVEAPAEECRLTPRERWTLVLEQHDQTWGFHRGLEADHPYQSDPVSWPILRRPVAYHYVTESSPLELTGTADPPDAGQAAQVLLLGNPAVWWGFLAVLPLLVAGVAAGDRRSLVPLLGWAGGYLPWLAVSRPAFLFYMVPVVPFMVLGLAVAIAGVTARRALEAYGGALTGAGAGLAAGVALGAPAIAAVVGTTIGTLASVVWSARGGGTAAGAATDGLVADVHHLGTDGLVADVHHLGTDDVLGGDEDQTHTGARFDAPPTPAPPGGTAAAVPALAAGLVLVSAGLAVWFWPVWVGTPIAEELLRQRWWFSSWI